MTEVQPIWDFLQRRFGLDPSTLSQLAIARTVSEGCQRLQVDSGRAYADLLAGDDEECQRFLDCLVVPETWFFRGAALYAELRRQLPPRLRNQSASQPFRILSFPCSTGEEPYSLVITLTESQIPANCWTVEAADLSQKAIAAAERGIYRDFSFRELPAGMKERYFTRVDAGWELEAGIRQQVRFYQANLLDSELHKRFGTGSYDLILCRNLLIYLTRDARQSALMRLFELLKPSGWLAVGPAEAGVLRDRQVDSVGKPEAFLFTRRTEADCQGQKPLEGSRDFVATQTVADPPVGLLQEKRLGFEMQSLSTGLSPDAVSAGVPESLPQSPDEQSAKIAAGSEGAGSEPVAPTRLAAARRLADAGRITEAIVRCRQAVLSTPTASGYCLLGILHQSREEMAEAASAFRRALYLEPNHRDTLIHAMMLARQLGQIDRAEAIRGQLERLAREDSK